MKHSVKLLLICSCASFLAGCKGDRAIQGFDLIDPDNLGTVRSMSLDSLETAVAFDDTLVATGDAAFLLLGLSQNVSSRILMRWENVPSVEDEILEATIILTSARVLGPTDSKRSFPATVHRVTADWEETTVTHESLGNSFDLTPIGGGEITTAVQVTVADTVQPERTRIPLTAEGVALVNQWRDTTVVDFRRGIIIDFASADFMKFFEGRNSVDRPRLEMITRLNDTDRDTLLFAPSGDSYLIEKTSTLPAGPFYVDHVTSQQFVIKFGLGSIPRESVVNLALLVLNVDAQNSVITDAGFTFQIIRLAEEFQEPNIVVIDSTFAPININVEEGSTGLATPAILNLFQDWVSAIAENHGILIRTATPGRDVSRVAFFSPQTDVTMAPSIQVKFSVAPPGEGQQ